MFRKDQGRRVALQRWRLVASLMKPGESAVEQTSMLTPSPFKGGSPLEGYLLLSDQALYYAIPDNPFPFQSEPLAGRVEVSAIDEFRWDPSTNALEVGYQAVPEPLRADFVLDPSVASDRLVCRLKVMIDGQGLGDQASS